MGELRDEGFESIAISLMNSYVYSRHELAIEDVAKEYNFKFVSVSHKLSKNQGYLSRTSTTVIDAYLNPVIKHYVNRLKSEFDNPEFPIYFMSSDGALVDSDKFTGCQSILSGPAGGVTGFSKTTLSENMDTSKIIGFDMGGTSTDVSIFDGEFELNFESEIAEVFITQPHLDINTVAAGGGSRLFYRNGMVEVGPQSAGSDPGPVCYGKGGHLTITDCNLKMGRICGEDFPKIFGKNFDEGLNEKLSEIELNAFFSGIRQMDTSVESNTDEELAFGFLKVANEVMCKPVRSLTQGKGKDPKDYVLAIFGGAGAQHACGVARNLGIDKIFIHKYSSILSAFGIFLADIS